MRPARNRVKRLALDLLNRGGLYYFPAFLAILHEKDSKFSGEELRTCLRELIEMGSMAILPTIRADPQPGIDFNTVYFSTSVARQLPRQIRKVREFFVENLCADSAAIEKATGFRADTLQKVLLHLAFLGDVYWIDLTGGRLYCIPGFLHQLHDLMSLAQKWLARAHLSRRGLREVIQESVTRTMRMSKPPDVKDNEELAELLVTNLSQACSSFDTTILGLPPSSLKTERRRVPKTKRRKK